MSDTTPEAIAQWMLSRLSQTGRLYQAEAVQDIAARFGDEYIRLDGKGSLVIDKRVLKAFSKLAGDAVTWDRLDFCWRRTEPGGAPGRKRA